MLENTVCSWFLPSDISNRSPGNSLTFIRMIVSLCYMQSLVIQHMIGVANPSTLCANEFCASSTALVTLYKMSRCYAVYKYKEEDISVMRSSYFRMILPIIYLLLWNPISSWTIGMADADKVQPLFSTLELVSNDRAANYPEKDLAINAPEHDRTAETAQVSSKSAYTKLRAEADAVRRQPLRPESK